MLAHIHIENGLTVDWIVIITTLLNQVGKFINVGSMLEMKNT